MRLSPLMAAAILAIQMTASPAATQAQADVVMPEVQVSSQAEVRPHPQDNTYSERPLGCVEIVTPNGTGNELGGHFQARFARDGIPVMPNLNDPTSAMEIWRKGPTNEQSPKTPPGQEGKPGCQR